MQANHECRCSSRLPQNTPDFKVSSPPDVFLLETTLITQIDDKLIAAATKKILFFQESYMPCMIGLQKWPYSRYIQATYLWAT